mgnify:CR=1 FL=1
MKLIKYTVEGIRKGYSEKSGKNYCILSLRSVDEFRSDSFVGHSVAQVFGKGSEYIGDEISCVTIDGKTVIIDEE